MPWWPNPNGGPPIQAPTNPNPAGGSLGLYSDPSYNGPPPGSGGGGGSSGGGGGGGGAPQMSNAVQQVQQAASAFGNVANTMTAEQLAEQKREFDANLAWQQQMWQQQGLPQLVIQQRSQQLQEAEFQFQMSQAQQNMALQQAQILGYYVPPGPTPTLASMGLGGSSATAPGASSFGQPPTSGFTGDLAMDAFNNKASAADQQTYLNAAGGDRTAAAQHYWQDVQGAIQSAIQQGQFQTPAQFVYGPSGAPPTQTTGGTVNGVTINGVPAGGIPTEQHQEFVAQNQLAQNQLAANVLNMQAQLSGPANWVQAANFARGISNTNIPSFMTSLLGGTPTTATTGSVGLSSPQSLTNLASQTGAGGGKGMNGASDAVANNTLANGAGGSVAGGGQATNNAGDLGATLNLGRALFSAGGGALGPQALEGLTDTERQMLGSVGNAVGADMPTFMNQYARSRIGQTAAQAA